LRNISSSSLKSSFWICFLLRLVVQQLPAYRRLSRGWLLAISAVLHGGSEELEVMLDTQKSPYAGRTAVCSAKWNKNQLNARGAGGGMGPHPPITQSRNLGASTKPATSNRSHPVGKWKPPRFLIGSAAPLFPPTETNASQHLVNSHVTSARNQIWMRKRQIMSHGGGWMCQVRDLLNHLQTAIWNAEAFSRVVIFLI
jgi:hypothetical protein